MILRTQKGIIHDCRLSVHCAMALIVLNFGGQLVHLDMATWFWTSSPGRPGFDPRTPIGIYVSDTQILREINVKLRFWPKLISRKIWVIGKVSHFYNYKISPNQTKNVFHFLFKKYVLQSIWITINLGNPNL